MLLEKDVVRAMLRCPRTGHSLLQSGDSLIAGANAYPIVNGHPVLIPLEKSILSQGDIVADNSVLTPKKRSSIKAWLGNVFLSPPSVRTVRNVALLLDTTTRDNSSPRVLVVGGGTIGRGMQPVYSHPQTQVVAFDIYASPHIQFLADAHFVPLSDESFDAVIVQAVLEHVLDPNRVVQEIHRLLKPQGIVYAETPFLQHVHAGAYDFTRFTESGHRYLFKDFARIHSGVLAGAGTQLIWALDFFFRGLFRSRNAGILARLSFAWLRMFDKLIPDSYNIDAASAVFFLGRKHNQTLSPTEAAAHYQGAQQAYRFETKAGQH